MSRLADIRLWCLIVCSLRWCVIPAPAATVRWAGSDSVTTISSVTHRKEIFLQLAEARQKLPLTLVSEAESGLIVLCSAADCRPVYLMDEAEVIVRDSAAFVKGEVIAGALGCEAKRLKRGDLLFECPPGLVLQRVGSEVGHRAPGFRLAAGDSAADLRTMLSRGPVVVAFVRSGEWDPQSRLLLQGLQSRLDSLRGAGVQLLAIHGYDSKAGHKWADSLKVRFPLLSDPSSAVMRGYGVFHRGNLPHPTLFLIGRDGIIRHRERLDPAALAPDLGPLMEAVGKL